MGFWAKVDAPSNEACWLWTGARNWGGYGVAHNPIAKKVQGAHRVAWHLATGSLPPAGLDLDHLCRNRACVNPFHLEPVTRQENLRRGVGSKMRTERAAKRTHCKNGHPWDDKNTGTQSNGARRCLACHRDEERVRRANRA